MKLVGVILRIAAAAVATCWTIPSMYCGECFTCCIAVLFPAQRKCVPIERRAVVLETLTTSREARGAHLTCASV